MHILLIILTGICLACFFLFGVAAKRNAPSFNWMLILALVIIATAGMLYGINYLASHPH